MQPAIHLLFETTFSVAKAVLEFVRHLLSLLFTGFCLLGLLLHGSTPVNLLPLLHITGNINYDAF